MPGYGHAVLRNTDPRFMHLKGFADKHIKDDYICDLARECFNTIPGILGKVGKIKNPYPNVDAFSGSLLQHFGTFILIFRHERTRFLYSCVWRFPSSRLSVKRYLGSSIRTPYRETQQYRSYLHREASMRKFRDCVFYRTFIIISVLLYFD